MNKPNLSMAMAISKKNRKMAKGGMVKDQAASEPRPMPSETAKDSASVARNSANKPLVESTWSDAPTVRQARKPSTTPLSHPKLVGSDAFSVRRRDEVEQERRQEAAFAPNDGPQEEPSAVMDEEAATKGGPSTPALGMKMMAEGGMVDEEGPASKAMQSLGSGGMAEGGNIDHDSLCSAIMAKRRRMADGDMVDLDENSMESSANQFDERNHAILKENFDSDMRSVSDPMDSAQMDDPREDETSDPRDRVSSIRSRMKSRAR